MGRHIPKLITEGHVYLALPPLYRIEIGKEIHWALDDAEKQAILRKAPKNAKPDVSRFKQSRGGPRRRPRALLRLVRAFFTASLVLAVAILAACGAVTETACEEGEQLACTCPDGEPSQRICLAGGSGFSTCIGCRRDGGVEVPPLEEDLREPVLAANDDAGPPQDLAGADFKSMGCSASTCQGCCEGNTCVTAAMQTDARCHVGSLTACQQCPQGFACVADQACAKQAPSCDAASCPGGCCDGTVCLSPDPDHCGTGGGACASCAKGTLCTLGACANDLDPGALFHVTITSLETESTNAAGVAWDTTFGGSPPDPKVCFYDSAQQLACTKECTDGTTCSFSATDGLLKRGTNAENDDAVGPSWPFYGSELASGLPFRVWDMDYIPLQRYETMASGTMFKITKLQTSYAILPFQRVRALTFTLRPL